MGVNCNSTWIECKRQVLHLKSRKHHILLKMNKLITHNNSFTPFAVSLPPTLHQQLRLHRLITVSLSAYSSSNHLKAPAPPLCWPPPIKLEIKQYKIFYCSFSIKTSKPTRIQKTQTNLKFIFYYYLTTKTPTVRVTIINTHKHMRRPIFIRDQNSPVMNAMILKTRLSLSCKLRFLITSIWRLTCDFRSIWKPIWIQ